MLEAKGKDFVRASPRVSHFDPCPEAPAAKQRSRRVPMSHILYIQVLLALHSRLDVSLCPLVMVTNSTPKPSIGSIFRPSACARSYSLPDRPSSHRRHSTDRPVSNARSSTPYHRHSPAAGSTRARRPGTTTMTRATCRCRPWLSRSRGRSRVRPSC